MTARPVRRARVALVLVGCVVAALGWAGLAQAATIAVNTTADVAPVAGDCSGASSCSLRQAIDTASPGDTISLPAGTYTLTLGSELEIAQSLTIQGAGAATTTIDGSGNDDNRILQTIGGAIAIGGVTFTGGIDGNESGPTLSLNGGGAIFNDSANLSLTDDVFSDNAGSNPIGGAVATTGGTLTMTDDSFTDNGAAIGGALRVRSGTVTGSAVTFSQNYGEFGGASVYVAAGSLTLTNSTIDGSAGLDGFGIAIQNAAGAVSLASDTITESSGYDLITDSGGAHTTVQNTIIGAGGRGECEPASRTDSVSGGTTATAITSDGGNNLDQEGQCALTGSGDVTGDPMLAPLADNDGPTQTEALLDGSPALAAGASCPGVDERGLARTVCDIGAYGAQFTAAPSATTDAASDLSTSGGSSSALLNATVNTAGEGGAFFFEWGTSAGALDQSTTLVAVGAPSSATPEPEELSGLAPGETYYFRAVARNASATTVASATLSFTTPAGCSVPSDSYATSVLADSPLLYFPLNDTGTGLTMCDASGNASNGTYASAGVTYGQPGPLLSDASQTAVQGDGSTQSPSLLGRGGVDTLSGDVSFTLEGWYRSTGTTQDQILVAIPGVTYAFGLGIWHNVSCGTGDGPYASTLGLDEQGVSNCWNTSTAGVNLYDGSWHYLAIAYDSTSRVVTGYVDGESLGSQPVTAVDASTQFSPGAATYIGNWVDTSLNKAWTGDAAQIAIYGTALSSTRIQAHYTAAGYGASSDDTLSALSSTAGTLSPAFSSSTTSYTVSVPNATTAATVTGTANNAHATLSLTSPSVASLTSGTASSSIPLAVGQTTITVHVLAQDNSTAQNYTITVTRAAAQQQSQGGVPTPASQTIDFTSTNPSPVSVGRTYTPAATASSGLAVAITLDSASSGCTLANGVVTFTAIGTCVIDANQDGNGSFAAASQVQQTITFKKTQTVAFDSTNPSPVTYTSPTLVKDIVKVSATSGLEASISIDSSSTSGACTRGGVSQTSGKTESVITFTGAGTCVIDVGQVGDSTYAPAPQVQQQVTVSLAAGVPGAPTGVTATGAGESAKLTWTKPASTGSSAISGYTVFWRENSADSPNSTTVGGNATSDTVTGLADGTSYQFAVAATNAAGAGPASSWVSATPTVAAPLPAPTLTAKVTASNTVGEVKVTLTWSNPTPSACTSTACKVSGYTLDFTGYERTDYHGTPGTTTLHETKQLGKTETSLASDLPANQESDSFSLVATNSYGTSPKATVDVVLEPAPNRPDVHVLPGVGSATLSWDSPASAYSLTGFDIYMGTSAGNESSAPLSGSAITTTQATAGNLAFTKATVNGLQPGTTYYFTVTDTDASGTSPQSSEVSATTPEAPTAPTGLTATAGNREVLLGWGAPSSAGGSPITGYDVYEGGGKGSQELTPIGSTTSTTMLVRVEPSLVNGTTYHFTVRAVNAVGPGDPSVTAATPEAVPGSPTGLTATPGGGQVTLAWTAPSSTGGSALTGYDVYEGTSAGGEASTPVLKGISASATSTTVTGLTAGTTYYFGVAAVNASGTGFASDEASATPSVKVNPPSAPLDVKATAGNDSVLLQWSPPSSNGQSALTGYDVYYGTSAGGEGSTAVESTASTDVLVRNDPATIRNGTTYYFVVKALNSAGASTASAEASATPEPVPGSPTNLTASSGAGQVTLKWTAPSSTGGSPLTGYDVFDGTASGREATTPAVRGVSPSATSATVTGLTGGKTYYFYVTAANGAGAGFGSNEASAIPTGPPDVPTTVKVSAGPEQVTVKWAAPSSDGGSAITGYTVLWRVGSAATQKTETVGASVTSDTVSGLDNGTDYEFAVEATNALGAGAQSTWTSSVPTVNAPPLAPTDLTAVVAPASTAGLTTNGEVDVTLTWTAPDDGGCPSTDTHCSMSGYTLEYESWTTDAQGHYVEKNTSASISSSKLTTTVKNLLDNSQDDTFELYASNPYGKGAVASVTVVLEPLPTTPVVTATPAPKEVKLSWTQTDAAADPVTRALVYEGTSPGGESSSPLGVARLTSQTSHAKTTYTVTVNGLTNGTTYYFTLAAGDVAGTTDTSAEVSATPADVAGAPTGLTAVPGNAEISLKWNAPSDTGGAITGYDVYAGPISDDEYQDQPIRLSGTATSTTLTYDEGFFNGGTYYIEVEAVNPSGNSLPSNEVAATPLDVPTSPTAVTATPGNGEVLLSWTAPSGGATGYEVYEGTASGGEGASAVASPTTTSVLVRTDPELENGTTYYFTVRAVNSLGVGNASDEVSATPAAIPDSPTALTATSADGKVSLSWTAPASPGGSALTGYDLYEGTASGSESTTPAMKNISPSATSVTVSGLANGTKYFFYLAALNASGTSLTSNEVSATPATLPGSPSNVVAVAGNTDVALSWTAPASSGGSAITEYDVYYGTSKGGEGTAVVASSTTTHALVRNDPATIHNGTTYYFVVRAVNGAGTSADSNEVFATPEPVPGNPTGLTATAGLEQVTLDWTAPSSTGGSALTGYDVYEGAVTGGESSTPVLTGISSSATTATVTGLSNGKAYLYVKALNSSGAGFASNEASATPIGAPSSAGGVTAKPGPEQVTVSWTAPAYNGGSAIASYTVIWREGTSGTEHTASVSKSTTVYTVPDLSDGTAYEFAIETLASDNTHSQSPWLAATPTVSSPPPAPILTASVSTASAAGKVSVKLQWTNPTAAGCSAADCAVSGYRLAYGPVAKQLDASATSFSVDLSESSHPETFTLTASNTFGAGPSGTIDVVLAPPPPPPSVTATHGSGTVVLKWTFGDSITPLTGFAIYEGTSSGGESSTPLDDSAYTDTQQKNSAGVTTVTVYLSRLTSGTAYYFTVTVRDAGGTSAPSREISATPS